MTKKEFEEMDDTAKYYLFKSAQETIQIQNDLILSLKADVARLQEKKEEYKGQWGDH